ncbi:hypothetical protein [Helicobacter cetorum]|uniref:Chemotaxis protein n=1 Tax=Helicobacter cetorum (strain ATCC BAA-429 / MIT 00-7128) TaxID=182217 RepID=I0EPY0_HELC0|nr:hypothetical protein [Helicobacter cetorum]AFI04999.1 hypothetical protein HCW_08720 [Helicobacter cetorum MIT 00-7128]
MLPLALGGIAAVIGVGARKAYDGYEDRKTAENIQKQAQRYYECRKLWQNDTQKITNESLENLGRSYLEVGKILNEFDTLAQKLIKKFNAHKQRGGLDFKTSIPQAKLTSMRDFSYTAVGVLGILAGSSAVGAAAAFATYGGVMALGAASTGTAIASLNGVAATNATLAALGGGSLAAGGFGIAGGTAVLGGVVAAPIIAIAGFAYASHGAECLKKAREYDREVDRACNKMLKSIKRLEEISAYAIELHKGVQGVMSVFCTYYFNILRAMHQFLKNGGDVNQIHTMEFLAKDSDSLETAQNYVLGCVDNGYKLASIITDMVTTPIFKYKEDDKINLDSYSRVIAIDKDYQPEIQTDEVGNVLNIKGIENAKNVFEDIAVSAKQQKLSDFISSKF